MGQTVQLVVVLAIVAVAAAYVVRRLWAQLTRSEDEAGGCSGCALNPAMQEKLRKQAARQRKQAGKASAGSGAQIVHLGKARRS